MKLFFFSFDELILPSRLLFVNTFSHIFCFISVLFYLFLLYFYIFTNYWIYLDYFIYTTRKAPFLQKSKWVFKKGFLQIYVMICGRF